MRSHLHRLVVARNPRGRDADRRRRHWLLDLGRLERLSNHDALTRAHLPDHLMQIHAALGNTVLMIAHDMEEAVLRSNRIGMLTNGPAATTVGLEVPLPRPSARLGLLTDATYIEGRAALLDFLHRRTRCLEAA